ncbi:HAD family hydrolase [Fulvivirga sediminis]|uniref:HAD-IA family hydrolase n=1 Tax=Fulvivirga sediminis TaxID=2803949 RepID=A0A937F3L8_9BACT|nr:HAD-IA family hydrolase [Fulvivirga sediminis]MBL3655727.1 HAD-IA family hydrolase [Fulvivirga sediminis]
MFKHLIFDCDGVLVDTEIVAAEVVSKVLNKYGREVSLDQYIREYTGKLISVILNTIPSENREGINIQEIMHECEIEIYNQLRPVADMPEVVKTLPLPKSVVSNSALWQVEKAINHVGLNDVFDQRYFSAEMVPNPKPAPDVYLHASETLGIDPSNCLVVEDSKAGVNAAVKAGMTVIGFVGASHILPGHAEALSEIGAKHIAKNAQELQSIIKDLTK